MADGRGLWCAYCGEQHKVHRTAVVSRAFVQVAAGPSLRTLSRTSEFAARLLRAGALEFLRQKAALFERGRQHRTVFEQSMSGESRWTLRRARAHLPSSANPPRLRRAF